MARFPDQFQFHEGVWSSPIANPTAYSNDEAIEASILDVLKNSKDLCSYSQELEDKISDWHSRYHLSPFRANLLRGFQFKKGSRVLEIGSGCGAITRFFGEQELDVVALEPATRRAAITRERCRELKNVQVLNCKATDIEFQLKFDIVTLIGALEYSAKVGPKQNLEDFKLNLQWARAQLNEGGILILAIENKFGIKYFSGCREDHSDRFFESIEGYYSEKSHRTFGRKELENLFQKSGFTKTKYFLPFPDYKFPSVNIASRENYKDSSLDLNLSAWCDMPFESYGGRRLFLMNDHLALREIEKNGLLDEFANSFLYFATNKDFSNSSPIDLTDEFVAQKVNLGRHLDFQTVTTLALDGKTPIITKKPLRRSIDQTERPVTLSTQKQETYIHGHEKLSLEMVRAARGKDTKKFWELFRKYYSFLLSHSNELKLLPSDWMDVVPFNIMISPQGELKGFDFEWVSDKEVPVEQVLFRAAITFFMREGRWLKNFDDFPSSGIGFARLVFKKLNLRLSRSQTAQYLRHEHSFQKATGGWREPLAAKRSKKGMLASYLIENLHHPKRIMRDVASLALQSPYFLRHRKNAEVQVPITMPITDDGLQSFSHNQKQHGYWTDKLRRLFLLDHWFLLENFVVRNLKVKYRRSVFGFFWTLLHPLLLGSIFFFLFKFIAKIQIPNYGAFVVLSIMPWTFFSQSVVEAAESMSVSAHLLRKIYFPRETFPMGSVVTNFITLCFSIPVMVMFAYLGGGGIGPSIIALVPVLLLTLLCAYGVGLILSVAYIFYRDVRHIIGILIQIMFYATPVIYDPAMVPENLKWALYLNPMAALIPAYRDILLYRKWPNWEHLGVATVIIFGILAVAYNYFGKRNKVIPEYV